MIRNNARQLAASRTRQVKNYSESIVEIGLAARYINMRVNDLKLAIHTEDKLNGVTAPKVYGLSTRGQLYFEIDELDAYMDRLKKNKH